MGMKVNDYFLISLENSIIDKKSWVYSKKWFEYLISLNNIDFKEYFLKLLRFFNDEECKKKLVKWHEYNSILNYEDDNYFEWNSIKKKWFIKWFV
jgi:formylmethanofuran dehydrogenase subunit E